MHGYVLCYCKKQQQLKEYMIGKGDEVGWLWAGTLVTGEVIEVFKQRHQIETKGKTIVRNGTEIDPALVIRHQNGTLILKLQHEVQSLSKRPVL